MSFFLSDDALSLDHLRLPHDPYFSHWIVSLVPLFERWPGLFDAFFEANAWGKDDLPVAFPAVRARSFRCVETGVFPIPVFEAFAKSISLKRLPIQIREGANLDTRIVLTDAMLKFHTTDRRAHIADYYETCLKDVS